jgi:acetyl esterase/lipase
MESFARPLAPDCTAVALEAGGIPAEWVRAPGAGESRTILYLHGGGYVMGSLTSHREVVGRISRASKARVLLLDYRLGPESPFPAAVDDAVAAYAWLLNDAAAGQIVIAGDSAGGGLTLATLLAIRDRGLPLPAGAVGISPWTDLTLTGDSIDSRAELDPLVSREGLLDMAAGYLKGADPRNPLASPLYGDLKGLPPILVQVGTHEALFDDATRFDARARVAGVDARISVWNNVPHVWHMFAGMLPEGRDAIEEIGAFVGEVTASP